MSMMLPLIHHGMVMVGVPYSVPDLRATEAGGTPYGASHWSTEAGDRPMDDRESAICRALGKRWPSGRCALWDHSNDGNDANCAAGAAHLRFVDPDVAHLAWFCGAAGR